MQTTMSTATFTANPPSAAPQPPHANDSSLTHPRLDELRKLAKGGLRRLADHTLWPRRSCVVAWKWLASRWCMRMLSIIAIAFVAVGAWIMLRLSVHQEKTGIKSVDGQPPRRDGIYFYGGLQKWNMDTRSLNLNWAPQWCSGRTNCMGYLDIHVFLFTDVAAFGIGGFYAGNATAEVQSQAESTGLSGRWVQSVDLVVKELPRREATNFIGIDIDALYPFDFYTLRTLIAAVDAINLSLTYPVHGADIVNSVQIDWLSSYSYNYIDLPERGAILDFTVVMRRHPIVKAAALLIAVINWMLTITLAYTAITIQINKRQFPPGMDGVALMFTALFALPSVRSTMPGNPPLGCLLDAVGIIPNLLIVSICGTSLLIYRMRRDAPQREVTSMA